MYDNIRQYTPKGSFLCDYSLLAARVAVSNLHKMTIAVPLGHVHGWLLGVGGGGRLRRDDNGSAFRTLTAFVLVNGKVEDKGLSKLSIYIVRSYASSPSAHSQQATNAAGHHSVTPSSGTGHPISETPHAPQPTHSGGALEPLSMSPDVFFEAATDFVALVSAFALSSALVSTVNLIASTAALVRK